MDRTLLDRLQAIVGPSHVLTGIDLSPHVVEGRTPEAAVFPGSVDEVRAVVALAAESGTVLVPRGGGTAAAAGTPPADAGIVLGLKRLDRVLEHEPGDLTATAQAGATLASLQSALRARGQWVSLDPPDPERATIGGVVAANASGPRRHLYGTARDLLIGLTAVTAEGAVVRGGGKVVKNVAGYDLPKLFVGSCGTLGVIVEVTLRLRPLPEVERLVGARFERLKDAGAAVRAIMGSDLIPNAIELRDAEESRARGLGALLVVGFDGVAEQVDWQCQELARLIGPLGARDVAALPATALDPVAAAAEGAAGAAAVMRFSVLPTLVTEVMEQGTSAARQRGLVTAWSAHAGVGVITASLFSSDERGHPEAAAALLGDWRAMARAGGGWATLEQAPLAVKSHVPVWDDMGPAGRIMQRIKAQLDPRNILNPGRFVAGI
jgi:glycolate oxidase FAD binding subunit